MAEARRRYPYFALTDHGPQSPAASMTAEEALAQRAELRALERAGGPVLWHGAELCITPDGGLGFDDAFFGGFDLLIAAVHTRLATGRDEMTRRLLAAVEHPAVKILGHPTARVIGRRGALGFDTDAGFEAAARAGAAPEINAAPDRLDLSHELARRAVGLGALFVISSDAHDLGQLDNLRYGVVVTQRAWIPPERVINAGSTARLRHFLCKGRSP